MVETDTIRISYPNPEGLAYVWRYTTGYQILTYDRGQRYDNRLEKYYNYYLK